MNLYILGILVFLAMFAIPARIFAPWVPCWKKDLERIFKYANFKKGDIFYDLGCGDGRTVFYVAKKYQVKSIGIELAFPMFLICRIKQLFLRNSNVEFKFKNLFKEDLSEADVVYFFGMPDHLKNKLKPKLEKELKKGCKVLSYTFAIEGWTPDIVDKAESDDIAVYVYNR